MKLLKKLTVLTLICAICLSNIPVTDTTPGINLFCFKDAPDDTDEVH